MPSDANEAGAPAASGEPAAPKKKKSLTVIIVAGVMIAEAVGIFLAVRTHAAPAAAEAAAEPPPNPEQLIEKMDIELPVAECDAINRRSGAAVMVRLGISVRVGSENKEHATKLIEKRQSTIKDRVQMILRSVDPEQFNEPDLDSLKRQIKTELDRILEDEKLIVEVLIPQILQSQTRL
jgi:flagellar basal body-associated protein FliL